MSAFQKILVPTDFSACARKAAETALELAGAIGGAEVVLLHIYEPPTYIGDVVVQMPGHEGLTVSEYIRQEAFNEMKTFKEGLAITDGVKVTERMEPGHPALTLKKISNEEDYDLVVMGTHGRTGFAHLMLGSVAEKMARGSNIPVMTVREQ